MATLLLTLPAAAAASRSGTRSGTRCCAAAPGSGAAPFSLSRRSAGVALVGGALLLRGGAVAPPALALVKGSGAVEYRKALLAEFYAASALDYRSCLRLLLADVASGGHNGSVHFPEELARPENAGLSATVAALADVKAKIDAKGLTAPLSWTDAISWAARVRVGGLHAALRALADEALQLPRQTRTKSAFDAIVCRAPRRVTRSCC